MKAKLAQRGTAATDRSRQDNGACWELVTLPRRAARKAFLAIGGDELERSSDFLETKTFNQPTT